MSFSERYGSPPTLEKNMPLDQLKSSIQRNEYAVDPAAVAEAILALLVRRHQACS